MLPVREPSSPDGAYRQRRSLCLRPRTLSISGEPLRGKRFSSKDIEDVLS